MSYISKMIKELLAKQEDFDPANLEHVKAYLSLRNYGRQTSLRFNLEEPFKDVVSMMEYKLAQHYSERFIQ